MLILYRLWNADKTNRDRSRLENKTKKRHIILTGYCNYRDVASLLVYQWREDFVTDDYLGGVCGAWVSRSGGGVADSDHGRVPP